MKSKMGIFIFIFITVLILFISHFVLYDYLVRFFSIENFYLKGIFIVLMILLPVLFLASMITMHSNGALITRVLYYLTGLWHGVLVNFLVTAFASWFFIGLLKIMRINPNSMTFLIVGIVGTVSAILLSAYGVYNVNNMEVREITFSPRALPEAWKNKKAVHLSDLHLGSVLRDEYMQKIVKKIEIIKPDIVFITGDLFDSIDGSVEYFKASLKSLDAPLGVFFVTGNHETYLGIDKMNQTLEGTNIKVLNNEVLEINDLQIIGIDYPERMAKSNLLKDLKEMSVFNPQKINILLYHEPRFIKEIKGLEIDLMLSGHTHKGQLWPFNFVTNAIFEGYDHGFFKEDEFHLNVSSGAGVWGPTMRTSGKNEIVVINFK